MTSDHAGGGMYIEYNCDPTLQNCEFRANSAYFGWTRRIKTVKEAITRLGTNRVFQMVLCMSVAPLVRKPIKGYGMDANQLWEHSFAAAVCAEKLTQVWRGADPALLGRYERQRRKVALETVQATSMRNRQIMNTREPAQREVYFEEMRRTAGDREKARAYLLRSSMIQSLRDLESIA